jgi:hypothetical protein
VYDVGASPPTGAVQFSVTVEPETVAEKFVGAPGALIGAAVAGRSGVAGPRGAGQPDVPNVPVPVARVKHDHVTAETPPPAAVELGPETAMPDGATGARPDPPPQAAMHTDAVVNKTNEYDRIQPPRVRRQHGIVRKC